MTCFSHSVVGVIEIEPGEADCGIAAAMPEDATLELWFESMAGKPLAARAVLCISQRWNRGAAASSSSIVPADLDQLLHDLQLEYERVIAP